eukprot:TRINITY_DN4787_c0_g1_i1.p1 TRINITY_DN4787_c0_g1~~TRINITY_DN4787_c0_g1_i1.p1  ORF type:complete len:134 (+),score=19.63 TRINITY_DN4787_c0_g1_i1:37-438(+)
MCIRDSYGTNDIDACYNIFHREAIDQVLPYNTMLDEESWWSSQQFVSDTVYALYPNHVFRAGPIYLINAQSRPYPRGMAGFDRIHEAVWGGMPKHVLQGGMHVAEKKRHYGDVCSCDAACHLSFCRNPSAEEE